MEIAYQSHLWAEAAALFAGQEHTMVDATLQGHMGRVWATGGLENSASSLEAAAIVNNDFCFPAGKATGPAARALLAEIRHAYAGRELIFIGQAKAWRGFLEHTFASEEWKINHPEKETRYHMKKNLAAFDTERLRAYARQLAPGYRVAQIDGSAYDRAMEEEWSQDFCAGFSSKEDFLARGLGYVVWQGEALVGGASSYVRSDVGIEVQVEVRAAHRRRGLARACAAHLILDCLARGWYPAWDAANQASLALAQSLGYQLEEAYPAWTIELT